MARLINGKELIKFPRTTAIGSQAYYLENASKSDFQPMNTNYGIFPPLFEVNKHDRKEAYSIRSLKDLKEFKDEYQE